MIFKNIAIILYLKLVKKYVYGRRWDAAHKAERKYWHTRIPWLRDYDRYERYWHEMLKVGFSLDFDFFLDKRILEIGCGPAGIIFSIHNAKYKVGIEPMDISEFFCDPGRMKIVKTGLGENLEFEDNSFDLVLCFNALDHTVNPPLVIENAYRVLRPEGEFLLWLHVLLPVYVFLKPVLNKFDSPHPYHFTAKEITNLLVKKGFEVKYKKIFRGLGPVTTSTLIPHNHNIKSKIGNTMMEDLWLRLNK